MCMICFQNTGSCRPSSGFSLIELLTVVSVVAISLVIAVPAFKSVIISNRLSATTNELIGSMQQAQLQAVKRNVITQFCSNSATNNLTDNLGNGCGGKGLGAVLWIDAGSTTPTEIQDLVQVPRNISIGNGSNGTTAVTALRYAGNGLATSTTGTGPYSGLVADIYSTSIATNNHRCIYMTTGSVISSCTVTGATGACPVNEPTSCQQ